MTIAVITFLVEDLNQRDNNSFVEEMQSGGAN
jgi:hypothetical protein